MRVHVNVFGEREEEELFFLHFPPFSWFAMYVQVYYAFLCCDCSCDYDVKESEHDLFCTQALDLCWCQ